MVHESSLSERICKDKALTGRLLSEMGVPTPKSVLVTSADEAVATAFDIGGPVVIKPVDGNKSRGVSVDLRDEDEIQEAFLRAQQISRSVLVQQYVEVEQELRVLASPSECVAVNMRVLPNVVGDGVSSIGDLIHDKNIQRQLNPSLRTRPIPVDEVTQRFLARADRSLGTCPADGEFITVRNVGGLGVGGETHQALEETSEAIKRAAVAAVASIPGLDWAGVDLIVEKDTGTPYVIEINTRAAYGAALFPSFGEPKDVASTVWKLRYDASAPESTSPVVPLSGRAPIPLGSSLGVEGAAGTSKNLAGMFFQWLEATGNTVNFQSAEVCRVGGRWFTSNALTEKDLSVVTQAVRQHGVVRRLLAMGDIRRVRGTRIASSDQLQRYLDGKDGQFIAVPVNGSWGSKRSIIAPADELVSRVTIGQPWFVQSR